MFALLISLAFAEEPTPTDSPVTAEATAETEPVEAPAAEVTPTDAPVAPPVVTSDAEAISTSASMIELLLAGKYWAALAALVGIVSYYLGKKAKKS